MYGCMDSWMDEWMQVVSKYVYMYVCMYVYMYAWNGRFCCAVAACMLLCSADEAPASEQVRDLYVCMYTYTKIGG